jgi:hypothetical protein
MIKRWRGLSQVSQNFREASGLPSALACETPVTEFCLTTDNKLDFVSCSSCGAALARERVMSVVLDPIRRESLLALDEIRIKDEKRRREIMNKPGCSPCDRPEVDPSSRSHGSAPHRGSERGTRTD